MANTTNMNGTTDSGPPLTSSAPSNVLRRVQRPKANLFAVARQPGQVRQKQNVPTPTPQVNGKLIRPGPLLNRSAPPSVNLSVASNVNTNQHSGFSDPNVAPHTTKYQDYKLVTTKKDLIEGLRFHVMHLSDDKQVDIRDPAQFSQPAHLHRRDPRSSFSNVLKDDQVELKDGLKENERENMSKLKELRQQERAANLAQIAPTQAARKNLNQKLKTKEVRKREYTEEEKRRIQTNYEEKLPWHLEDFDSKHCLVGENQGPQSHRHIAFVYESASDPAVAKFRMVPVEKIYDFDPKKVDRQAMSIEQAEAALKKRATMPEWLERVEEKSLLRKKQLVLEQQSSKFFSGEAKTNKFAGRTGEDADIDFDDDELFADDEEGDVIKNQDEDEKFAERRIKEDQLKANFFEVKTEREYDEEEEEEERERQLQKQNFKGYRKALEKHEGDFNHASDSEYSSSSDSEEETAEEAEKKKATQEQENANKPTAPPSGATTPSGRKEKSHGGISDRDGASKKSLKRPGSPNLSDAGSGTDTSTRKRPKTKHLSSTQPTPTVSRPTSPANAPPPSSAPQKLKVRPGVGSDTDGANLSDVSRRRKLKKSQQGGSSSRAGSPGPNVRPNMPSRPASIATSSSAAVAMPTLSEIRDRIIQSLPKGGMTVPEFINTVPHPKDRGREFIALTMQVAKAATTSDGRKVLVLKDDNSGA